LTDLSSTQQFPQRLILDLNRPQIIWGGFLLRAMLGCRWQPNLLMLLEDVIGGSYIKENLDP